MISSDGKQGQGREQGQEQALPGLPSLPALPSATGSLKIFFGYAAGVGKTYAMLAAAHQARQAGVDVVAGYVEPHARPATQALLDGLEVLPVLTVAHRGASLREFDLDKAIQRKPRLILVDEMAHNNAPGCRHLKRHQDIQELLRHGIDVYTTVNVQHVESLHDVVQSLTGVEVRERVPDTVFDGAQHVELVDIEPEALLERLRQGKVYGQEQAARALHHFFTLENLVALREIALRRTADMVSKAVEKNKALHGRGDYFTHEHLLVCLSSSPSNPRVIRTAARMAEVFHARLTALFVETSTPLSTANKARLDANARLAQELGAHLASVEGDDVAWHVAEFAKASNVSKIVMGRPAQEGWRVFRKANFIDQITALAPHLDVHVIPAHWGARPQHADKARAVSLPPLHFSWRDLAFGTGILAASTGMGFVFDWLGFSEATVIMAYMLGVLLTALQASSLFSQLFSSLGSVLAFNFFFTTPRLSFKVDDPAHVITFGVMLLMSAVISTLTKNLQQQKVLAAQKAYRTGLLLETSQKLQGARDSHEIISETGQQLALLLNRSVVMYPAHAAHAERLGAPLLMYPEGHNPHEGVLGMVADRAISKEERAVAQWCFNNRKQAGVGTGTLPGGHCLYMCIRGQDAALGVVAVVDTVPSCPLDAFEKGLLTAVLGQSALALDKERIRESKDKAFMQARHEALRANLLRAISHDLRTPLTSISGNAQMLRTAGPALTEAVRQRLCEEMCDDTAWLIGLVENILAVTRLEDGSTPLALEAELVDDCVEEALRHVRRHLGSRSEQHHLHVHLEDDVLLARMDARLIVQVLVNMVSNAVKYTPSGSNITVATARRGAVVAISVADDGPGIPREAQERLFDMFFTVRQTAPDSHRGLGLGLYLCKAIVTAHGGQIQVADNSPCGSIFTFTLPLAEIEHA